MNRVLPLVTAVVATAALTACSATAPSSGHWSPSVAGGGRPTGMTWVPDARPTAPRAAGETAQATGERRPVRIERHSAGGGRDYSVASVAE